MKFTGPFDELESRTYFEQVANRILSWFKWLQSQNSFLNLGRSLLSALQSLPRPEMLLATGFMIEGLVLLALSAFNLQYAIIVTLAVMCCTIALLSWKARKYSHILTITFSVVLSMAVLCTVLYVIRVTN